MAAEKKKRGGASATWTHVSVLVPLLVSQVHVAGNDASLTGRLEHDIR